MRDQISRSDLLMVESFKNIIPVVFTVMKKRRIPYPPDRDLIAQDLPVDGFLKSHVLSRVSNQDHLSRRSCTLNCQGKGFFFSDTFKKYICTLAICALCKPPCSILHPDVTIMFFWYPHLHSCPFLHIFITDCKYVFRQSCL